MMKKTARLNHDTPASGDIRHGSGLLRRSVYAAALAIGLVSLSPTVQARGRWQIKGKVNINTAPAKILVLLPGVGPSRARAIVAYRSKRKFRSTKDIVRVRGIGWRSYSRMKKFITVKGESTLRRVKSGASTKKKVRKAKPLGRNRTDRRHSVSSRR